MALAKLPSQIVTQDNESGVVSPPEVPQEAAPDVPQKVTPEVPQKSPRRWPSPSSPPQEILHGKVSSGYFRSSPFQFPPPSSKLMGTFAKLERERHIHDARIHQRVYDEPTLRTQQGAPCQRHPRRPQSKARSKGPSLRAGTKGRETRGSQGADGAPGDVGDRPTR